MLNGVTRLMKKKIIEFLYQWMVIKLGLTQQEQLNLIEYIRITNDKFCINV